MCGFTGLIKKSPVTRADVDRLKTAADGMAYRGPDETGIWSDSRVCMSHVRLSIIGVANGHQPIITEDGRFVLICNGEVYNYRELKAYLQARGHKFQTLSDSEVIIFAYIEYGMDFLAFIKGMFAFLLYDRHSGTLIAARDVAGKKPLYYAEAEDGVVFSSEIKAIAQNFLIPRDFDFEVIRQVQAQRYSISRNRTFIQGIRKVPPAHVVVCKNGEIQKSRMYDRRKVRESFSGSYEDAVLTTRKKLIAAVERRLESEVPIGILLSAGIDSSAIACIAAKLGHKVTAFSSGYRDFLGGDESFEAEKLANQVGLPFERVVLHSADFAKELQSIIDVIDEPNADPALFPQWALYKAISKRGYKVLLSGVGADEVFYGYPGRNRDDTDFSLANPSRARKIASVFKSLGALKDVGNRELISFLIKKSLRSRAIFSKAVLGGVERRAALQGEPPLSFRDAVDRDLENAVDRTYSALLSVYLPNNGFFLADKLGMAHSIEVRCPFADVDLRNFIDTLPIEIKFPRARAKGLLKDALRGLVPDYVLDRPKTGFTPPSGYIQDVVNNYRAAFFNERLHTFAHVMTDAMCAAYARE